MYNPTYHEENEVQDDELFEEFVNDTHYFKSYKRNEQYSALDYSAIDVKGRGCSIELKRRNFPHVKHGTTFCECEKGWLMINRYEQFGYIPLFINFFSDDSILIFDLRNIKQPDKELIYKRVTIMNHGYEEKQKVWRIELPNTMAILFKKINGHWVWIRDKEIV